MARIIEPTGNAGVGKTTIYEAVVRQWSPDANWEPEAHYYPRRKRSLKGTVIANFQGKTAPTDRPLDTRQFRTAGKRFVEDHPTFGQACARGIRAATEKHDDNFRYLCTQVGIMTSLFQRIQVVMERESDRYALLDEGLVKYLGDALPADKDMSLRETYKALCGMIPLPHSVIHVKASPRTVARRAYSRQKTIFTHESLTPEKLEPVVAKNMYEEQIRMECIREFGVDVFPIDAEEDIGRNAERIASYLETL